MTTSLQHARRISTEISSVVNNHRDWQSPTKHNGEEITRRRQAAEKLRRNGTYLGHGEGINHSGSWRWHVTTGAVSCSKEHLRIFGFDPEKVRLSNSLLLERIHPEDRPLFEQVLRRSVWEDVDFEHDYRIILPDGSTRFLRSAGRFFVSQAGDLEFIGTVIDITELKRVGEMQAALARERELFAQQRASELAKANEALLECLDAVASVPELDEFLGQVMGAMTRQLGAASSVLRLRNFEKNALTLDLVFQDRRVITPAEAKYPESLQTLPLDERQLRMLKEPATVMHLLDNFAAIPDSHRSYLVGLGVKTLLIIPLVIARRLIGSLTFRFTEDRDFRPEEIEIARALASQASLAIQLMRLAKAARQSAVLAERNELAGEIHDSLAQNFAAIAAQLSLAGEVIEAKEGDGVRYLDRAKDLAQFGLAEARRTAVSLNPFVLDKIGLTQTIEMLVERSNVPGRLQCSLSANDSLTDDLPPETQRNLLRIAQEAIGNAIRHANPTTISVSLQRDRSHLELQIRDNGRGISTAEPLSQNGFGLINMQNRANKIGASLHIRTDVGRGTAIVVRLPINP
jgi:PAS domain S-box-containing protein